MIDVDDTLRSELHRLVPIDSRRDWGEVVARSGLKRERARRRWAIGAVVVIAAVAVGVATPLGAAIGRGLDDFSAWLTGEPGTPASESEQREFEAANARSWLGFPRGTKLRHLITDKAGDTTVTLLGFRSGSSQLCLRLRVTGGTEGTMMSCAPLAEHPPSRRPGARGDRRFRARKRRQDRLVRHRPGPNEQTADHGRNRRRHRAQRGARGRCRPARSSCGVQCVSVCRGATRRRTAGERHLGANGRRAGGGPLRAGAVRNWSPNPEPPSAGSARDRASGGGRPDQVAGGA